MAEKNHLGEYLERVYPKHGELQVDEKGELSAIIVDAEMDGFICKFHYDECVHIDMGDMSYVTLDKHNLILMMNLIDEAQEIYDNRTQEEWDSFPD